MERVAAGHAADREPATAERAVPFDRLEREGAAGRGEAAAWRQHRADLAAVGPQQEDQQPAHREASGAVVRASARESARSRSVTSARAGIAAAAALARTTSEASVGSWPRRSRIRWRSRRRTP